MSRLKRKSYSFLKIKEDQVKTCKNYEKIDLKSDKMNSTKLDAGEVKGRTSKRMVGDSKANGGGLTYDDK